MNSAVATKITGVNENCTKSCKDFYCNRDHPKNRTFACRSGGNCTNKTCNLLHPVPARVTVIKHCRNGLNCYNMSCTFQHPEGFIRSEKVCTHDIFCMDSTCKFMHKNRRNACSHKHLCTVEACPWIHPCRGFEKLLVDSYVGLNPDILFIRNKLLKVRRLSMVNYAKACESRMKSVGTATTTVEQARLIEIGEQIAAFDHFAKEPFKELLQLDQSQNSHCGTDADQRKQLKTSSRQREIIKRLNREIYRLECSPKPALARRIEIINFINDPHVNSLVIRGDTGSGKSTQLPQYIAELIIEKSSVAGYQQQPVPNTINKTRKVICTQPRKVAAISLAERVNEEWAADATIPDIGGVIGYRVGNGGRKVSKGTVIQYVTEATLLQDILARGADALNDVDAIILDEAHERSVTLDILVGRLQLLRKESNANCLKIIVTSATLDITLFSKYFNSCPHVEIPGRMFPVVNIYKPLDQDIKKSIVTSVVECIFEIHNTALLEEGDILAFLPGQREVDDAITLFNRMLEKEGNQYALAQALPLYGRQDPEEQRPVFIPSKENHRKIVIATNVAETSVTIPGVCFVIDSGKEKKIVYDARQNVSSLREVDISRSSAQQRRGRAGRTAPGVCYRLYSEEDFDLMNETQVAEVLSQPINLTLLSLYAMGVDPATFPWLEAPDQMASETALQNLLYLGALEKTDNLRYQLTTFGQLAAQLQIDPSRARVLYEGQKMGKLKASADLVGIMNVSQNFFSRAKDPEQRTNRSHLLQGKIDPSGDLVTMYRMYKGWCDAIDTVAEQSDIDNVTDNVDGTNLGDTSTKKKNKKNWKNGDAYCDNLFMYKRTMTLIGKISLDMQYQVKNFIQKIDQVRDDSIDETVGLVDEADEMPVVNSSDIVDNEQLLFLVLSGYFTNIAVSVSDRGQSMFRSTSYQHITPKNDNIITGSIHPGSLLALHGSPAKQFICFLTMMNTSMLFLDTVTVLDMSTEKLIEIIYKISPEFANDMKSAINNICCQKVEVTGLSKSMMTGRKFATFCREISTHYKTTVQGNTAAGTFTAFCQQKQMIALKEAIEAHKRTLIEEAVNAIDEEVLAGSTRCVYMIGGEVKCVLFNDECISITALNLPDDLNVSEFRCFLTNNYGAVRILDVWEAQAKRASVGTQSSSIGNCVNNNKIAKITFENKDDAKNALNNLNKDFKKSLLVVRPNGIVTAQESDITGRLEITWKYVDDAQVDGVPLAHSLATLMELVPLRAEDPEIESFFFNPSLGSKCLRAGAGFRIHYKHIDDIGRAALIRIPPNFKADMVDSNSFLMKTIYECKIIINHALFEWIEKNCGNPISSIVQNCQSNYSTKGIQNVTIFLKSNQQNTIVCAKQEIMEVLICETFNHVNKDLLFSLHGRKRMTNISDATTGVCYIHWDHKSRTIRIYGTSIQRQDGLVILENCIKELENIQSKSFLLQKAKVPIVKRDEGKEILNRLRKESGIEEFEIRGHEVVCWGESQSVDKFSAQIEEIGWLKPKRTAENVLDTECSLCLDELDDSNIQLQCLHSFCKPCCSNNPIDAFPVKCTTCNQKFTLNDIHSVFDNLKLSQIKSYAQGYFKLNQGSSEVTFCVTQGCNMFVKLPPMIKTEEEKQFGGNVAHCENCRIDFCLFCSEKLGKVALMHKGETCQEHIINDGPDIKSHRKKIENMIYPRCPKCKNEFDSFEGCAALSCSCGCKFCAVCFNDCGEDAHSCAAKCIREGNLSDTTYFITQDTFELILAKRFKTEIIEYLKSIDNTTLRKAVSDNVKPLLIRCKIDVNDSDIGCS